MSYSCKIGLSKYDREDFTHIADEILMRDKSSFDKYPKNYAYIVKHRRYYRKFADFLKEYARYYNINRSSIASLVGVRKQYLLGTKDRPISFALAAKILTNLKYPSDYHFRGALDAVVAAVNDNESIISFQYITQNRKEKELLLKMWIALTKINSVEADNFYCLFSDMLWKAVHEKHLAEYKNKQQVLCN